MNFQVSLKVLKKLLLLVLLGLAACSTQATPVKPTPTPTVPPQPDIAGTSWTLVTYIDNDSSVHNALSENTPKLVFGEGQVSGYSGCNTFEGTYQREGGALYFNFTGMTENPCSDFDLAFQEQNTMDALVTVASYQLEGGQLKMLSPFGTVMLVYQPAP